MNWLWGNTQMERKAHNRWDYPVDSIRQWIAEGKTQEWIGGQLGVPGKLIYKVCKKHGIHCQRRGPRSGPQHPGWSGGRIIDKNGYVLIYCRNHRRARKPRCIYVLEHILVMEKVLGRALEDGEVVHHRNKDRQDNRPENLSVYSCNGKHLHDELKGHCPKWTPQGKVRLQQILQTVADNRRGITACEYRNRQRIARLKKRRCIESACICEMVGVPEQ